MMSVNSLLLNVCWELCVLTASPHNLSSLVLYMIASVGKFFELYIT